MTSLTDGRPRFRPGIPIVEAKLHPPPVHGEPIDRPRLIRLLDASPDAPVVSLIAPPGYGKTTLLAQIVERERRPVAWVTLDELDNDPAVLLTYLATALDRIEPVDATVRPVLGAPREQFLATAVPRLTSVLHRWDRPALIVFDDIHRLVQETCLDALTALIDHLPPGFRVVVSGRNGSGLPLARFRVQRLLLEIGTDQLAFDELETRALAASAGLDLTPSETRLLTRQSEGWAAGIYLATLAQERLGSRRGTTSLFGSDHLVAAYLRSEFEQALDEGDRTLLTRTAILETISAPVAEVVSGQSRAGERLWAIAHENLLVQQVGRDGQYIRYHNLLREFLEAELEHREPGLAPELHQRAARWYESVGNIDLAVKHHLAANEIDDAARVVTGAALATFRSGRAATVEQWLRAFDRGVFVRNPPLAVIAAWLSFLNGRAEATDQMADIAERSSFEGRPGDGTASFESQRAMLRAIMARHGPRDVLANAEVAAGQEGPASPWRAIALWTLGSARALTGDAAAADAILTEAARAIDPNAFGVAMAIHAKRCGLAMAAGDWASADEHARSAQELMLAGQLEEIVVALPVHAVSARVAIHKGDLLRGRELLVRAQLVRPLATHVVPWLAVDALLELARAYMAVSDFAGAQVVLREAEHIIRRRPALGVLTDELVDMRRRLASAATTLPGSSTLTGAELRLLPLLPTYLSFQEIGDRLVISRHTVKSQAMSIYGKLQASSRGEAVERAIELGLLEPFHGLGFTMRSSPD